MSETAVDVAPGVACLPTAVVNLYFLGEPGHPWVLVDTGMPGFTHKIKAAAEARYGPNARPEAIILTHGHFDHVGCLHALADAWDVPVYAHPLEFPYLTGQSKYPPFDPSVGGFFPFLSRFFPENGINISPRLKELPADGAVPGADGWTWHFTPGHAPGHVSLFRESDRTLVAGDAFITVNMDSFQDTVTKKQEMVRPPSYATCDWTAARQSVEILAGLNPSVAATGHGIPMTGPDIAGQLRTFAAQFNPPTHGRYIPVPAQTDYNGIVSVPPPALDPGGIALAVGAVAVGAGLLARRGHGDKGE
jgi:glyoxylase-like metal-dependent hydrolase (beta-lactamase superfamily II)